MLLACALLTFRLRPVRRSAGGELLRYQSLEGLMDPDYRNWILSIYPMAVGARADPRCL